MTTAVREFSLGHECLPNDHPGREATEALRGLVDAIVLTPAGTGRNSGIEPRANLAAILGATVPPEDVVGPDDVSLHVSWLRGPATN